MPTPPPPTPISAPPPKASRESANPKPDSTGPAKLPSGEIKLRFNFRFQPWKDVIEWFAQQAGFSLVADSVPAGTFNYGDDREYSPSEAIDLLNSVLLTKGYTLVRRDRMLMLINLQDGIPPNLVAVTTPDQLDKRGEYELVSVQFDLSRVSPEEAELEMKKMIGPQGSVVMLAGARQVLVTETGGRLRAIRAMLNRMEKPEGGAAGQVHVFDLRRTTSQNVLDVLRQLFDIPPDKWTTPDGSVRLALDAASQRLLISGKPDRLAKIQEILKAIDVPEVSATAPGSVGSLQLEVYSITSADPESALKVLQTLMNGQADVRLAIDPKSGNLVALARPDQQATIRATLEQMQRDSRRVEVIPLRLLDPQTAVASINKLFTESGGVAAPQVDADTTSRQILVRGSESQISQIHALLEKMGEVPAGQRAPGGANMRVLSGHGSSAILDRIQEVWPMMSRSKIRIVTPSAAIPSIRPGGSDEPDSGESGLLPLLPRPHPDRDAPRSEPSDHRKPQADPAVEPRPGHSKPSKPAARSSSTGTESPRPRDKSASVAQARIHLVSQKVAAETAQSEAKGPTASANEIAPSDKKATDNAAAASPPKTATDDSTKREPAPIVVAPGPGGVVIACEDPEVLDQFERLWDSMLTTSTSGTGNLTVFYLKHAKAAAVSETLSRIIGSGTASIGGSLMGDGGGDFGGGFGGGILGSLLGMGGGSTSTSTSSGTVRITPDTRLNALIVEAGPADMNTIEQILKVLDQKDSPEEILVAPKPRMIPVANAPADEIATIVRQVYQDRMVSSAGSTQQQAPPNPLEILQMLRGGRRGGPPGSSSGARGSASEEVAKLSVAVDNNSNSLIVIAPDPLFQEVKQLVEELDVSAANSEEVTQVVSLQHTNLDALQQLLSGFGGNQVQVTVAAGQTKMTTRMPSSGTGFPGMGTGMGFPGLGTSFGRSRSGYPFGGTSGYPYGGTRSYQPDTSGRSRPRGSGVYQPGGTTRSYQPGLPGGYQPGGTGAYPRSSGGYGYPSGGYSPRGGTSGYQPGRGTGGYVPGGGGYSTPRPGGTSTRGGFN